MNILISNDDGFDSIGTKLLTQILESNGDSVYLALPKHNCSGFSSKVHLSTNIRYYVCASNYIVVDGTPTDCVVIGLDFWQSKDVHMDFIVAGINQGMNLGISRRYSGTMAIIYEALVQGYPTLAISCQMQIADLHIEDISSTIIEVINRYLGIWHQSKVFGINMNVYSINKSVSYCDEFSVVNVTNRLLCATACGEQEYRIGVDKMLPAIDTKGSSVILGIVMAETCKYQEHDHRLINQFIGG